MRAHMIAAVLIGIAMLVACNDEDVEVAAHEPTPTSVVETGSVEAEPTPTPDPTPTPEPAPQPTPTAEPEPSATPDAEPPADGEPGSRENPVPPGDAARLGDWEIVITETIPDAWDIVPELQIINDPPEQGRQFFMVRLQATYHGEGSSQFWFNLELSAVDADGSSYDNYDDSCGINPDQSDLVGEASTGETVIGSICWSIQSESAETLIVVVEDWELMSASRLYFALNEE